MTPSHAAALGAILTLGILPLAGQAPKGEVILRSTTRLVQVNVIVQDKKGDPVADLKKENFQVLDRGKLQQVSLFSVEYIRKPCANWQAVPAGAPTTTPTI